MNERHDEPGREDAASRFAAALRELRMAKIVTTRRRFPRTSRIETGPISRNELAGRVGVDHAYISRLEAGRQRPPSRRVAEDIAAALELGPFATARLLALAGFWPWPELPDDVLDVVLGAGLAIADGDYRAATATPSIRRATEAG